MQLLRLIPVLTQLLRRTMFLLDYVLVVPRDHAAERWTGRRCPARTVANVVDGEFVEGHPMLLDRAGRVCVDLWPLVQAVPPSDGAEPELFLFDGHGHDGSLLIAAPSGLKHHDSIVRDWVATHVTAEIEAKTRMRDQLRVAAHHCARHDPGRLPSGSRSPSGHSVRNTAYAAYVSSLPDIIACQGHPAHPPSGRLLETPFCLPMRSGHGARTRTGGKIDYNFGMKPFMSPELADVALGRSLPLMRSSAQSEQPIHRWLLSVVFASGCFNPIYDNPSCGPNHECPTDFVCIDNTCRHSDGPAGAATVDAPSALFCAADPRLRLCYSFDQESLPAALPDEGAAVVDAQLTNVSRIARGSGGAALLDTTSSIFVPMTSEVTNIQALEIWYRADADPPNGGRSGLVDSNVSPPNIGLFLTRQDPGHQLRCGLGAAVASWDASLTVGSWIYLACVCEANSLKMYVDGVKVGETPGPCASGGAIIGDGFTIGSNNNGGPSGFNDWLVGAIDGVRLWDVPLTATMICQTAGNPSC